MDLYIGAIVESVEGQDVGTVERVIVDLDTNEVTHYVVHSEVGGRRDVMVPAALADERERILSLRITSQELESLPEYLQVSYGLPPHGLAIAPGERRLPPERITETAPQLAQGRTVEMIGGEPVDCVDGEVGALEGVVVDEITDEVTDLVIGVARRQKTAIVPTAWASRLGPNRIQLQCKTSEVESLAR